MSIEAAHLQHQALCLQCQPDVAEDVRDGAQVRPLPHSQLLPCISKEALQQRIHNCPPLLLRRVGRDRLGRELPQPCSCTRLLTPELSDSSLHAPLREHAAPALLDGSSRRTKSLNRLAVSLQAACR